MKWGGELTKNGKESAEDLGRWARETLYMGESAGLLRLHASYRHDLKIYSSDEGRVQMTAAAFAKGFLDFEGELPPILVGLVRRDGINSLLDETVPAERDLESTKDKLYPLINSRQDLDSDAYEQLNPDHFKFQKGILDKIGNFRSLLDCIAKQLAGIRREISRLKGLEADSEIKLYHKETYHLFHARWKKICDDFYDEDSDTYDISKLPDLFDNIKYDLMHNVPPLSNKSMWELYHTTQGIAAFVVAQEYGLSGTEKCDIGTKICRSLVRKISWDMQVAAGQVELEHGSQSMTKAHRTLHRLSKDCVASIKNLKNPDRIIRSRFYFTSESHVVALINTLRYGLLQEGVRSCVSSEGEAQLADVREYNYLTAISIRLFEDTHSDLEPTDPSRFLVEICVTPGIDLTGLEDEQARGDLPQTGRICRQSPGFRLNPQKQQLESMLEFLTTRVPEIETPKDVLANVSDPVGQFSNVSSQVFAPPV